MKKFLILTIFTLALSFAVPTLSFAQGMMGNNMMGGNGAIAQDDNGHTIQGETEGKAIWEKLQAKELNCDNLSDEDFHNLGMYFMGLMAGDSHEAMDAMMEQMMGEEGEDQMHIAMGKRMSGCDPNAPMPQNMPALSGVEGMNGGTMNMMMQMMMGGNNSMMDNFANNPMGWFGWGFGGIFTFLILSTWIVWLVVGILAAIWLWKHLKKK